MADMLAEGLSHLTDVLSEHASTNVTYKRGSYSVTLPALMGQQLLKTFDGQGNAKMERADADFDIKASLLIINGSLTTPARGDYITKTFGTVTKRFDVMPMGSNEPAWRYLDPNQTMLRVHCKFGGKVT